MPDKPAVDVDEIERLMHKLAQCRVELDHIFLALEKKYDDAIIDMALAELVWHRKCNKHIGFIPPH